MRRASSRVRRAPPSSIGCSRRSPPSPASRSVSVGRLRPTAGTEMAFDICRQQRSAEQCSRRASICVSAEYFATLQIPLRRGRIWDATENARGDFVAVVNQSFARRYLRAVRSCRPPAPRHRPAYQSARSMPSPRRARAGARSSASSATRATTASIALSRPPSISPTPR